MSDYILEIKNLSKIIYPLQVLDNINISIERGELHSIVGAKGSGKSTIVKILGGVYPCNSYNGEILIDGKISHFFSPKDSEKAGISIVYQDSNLIDQLSVYENIFLGKEIQSLGIINWQKESSIAEDLLHQLGCYLRNDIKLSNLSFGEKQIVKIVKALYRKTPIVVFDEPATGLTVSEFEKFIFLLEKLKKNGISCLYFTSIVKEALSISDRITVLKDGITICTDKAEEFSEESLLNIMIGRKLDGIKSLDSLLKEYGITKREKEIIQFLVKGYSNKEISNRLYISVNTVKTHIENIYQKLNINQRIDLVNLFMNNQ